MVVEFPPEVDKKLSDLAVASGCSTVDLVRDAVAEMVDDRARTREVLDSRYDDIKSGKVRLIPGSEVFARLRARSDAARKVSPPGS